MRTGLVLRQERVELIVPPEGVALGEKLSFKGVPGGPFEPVTTAQMEKKKILEKVLPVRRSGACFESFLALDGAGLANSIGR